MMARKDAPQFTAMVVDEHHDQLSCPKDRETAWKNLSTWAAKAKMPIILLSATSPPCFQQKFIQNFHLESGSTAFVRSPTNRPEIALHTIHLNPDHAVRALAHLVYALMGRLKPQERMLVFFSACRQAESFAKDHGFAIYHSKFSDGEAGKNRNLLMWDDGVTKVMACTSAFGCGVDRPNVRFVVIFNPFHGLMATLQMAGRAGRDGRPSHAFYATSEPCPTFQPDNDLHMTQELGQLMHRKECKVYQAMSHMDGVSMARKCKDLPGQLPCDVCQPNGEMHVFAKQAVKNPTRPFIRPGTAVHASSAGEAASPNVGTGFITAHRVLEKMAMQTREAISNDEPCGGMHRTADIFEGAGGVWPGANVRAYYRKGATD